MPRQSSCLKLLLLSAALTSAALAADKSGLDTAGMNPALTPGEDFYGYTSGTWTAKTEIPADRSGWGAGSALGEETNQRIIALIETDVKNRAAATPAGRLAADYYT